MLAPLDAYPVPSDVWRHWTFDPLVLALLALAAWLSVRGARRAAATGAPRPSVGAIVAWAGGLLLAALALLSPLNAMTHAVLFAHMAQYLLITVPVPLLLVLGRPTAMIAPGLPVSWRASARAWRDRAPWLRRAWRLLTLPPVTAAITLAALFFWHIPGPFQAALAHRPVWWLEQGSYLAAALLLWRGIAGARGDQPGKMLFSYFILAALETAFGLAMYSATKPWYPVYAGRTEFWRVSAHLDQQIAALELAVIDTIPDVITLLALLAALLGGEE